ncbi:hypothetical protein [Phormidium sp. CCY1219]|jgi:hypothetical protein|uniref:hypothetical protein n=1 Tax=Phormidium sp. CCY1219 TaxID=2886104 RepID=UPI002D1EA74F|nr:hypothetical protein [Phormidium sp. CCY1219]MEB3828666.1 hypothetical protein [Phormidium sp. CCY1219]
MLTNWVDFTLLTLLNAAVCLFLPRILTMNWAALLSKLKPQQRCEREMVSERVSPRSFLSALENSPLQK